MKETSSGGLGLGGVLLVVFIILKLVGVIDWSWWWVLSPLWIGPAILLVVAVVVLMLGTMFNNKIKKNNF